MDLKYLWLTGSGRGCTPRLFGAPKKIVDFRRHPQKKEDLKNAGYLKNEDEIKLIFLVG